jgi:hypothetical protein
LEQPQPVFLGPSAACFCERPIVNTEKGRMSVDATEPRIAKIDLHGHRPRDFVGLPMAAIVEQAWEMGAGKLRFIHGHGRTRGKSPGFYNTKTGWLGLRIRRELRRNRSNGGGRLGHMLTTCSIRSNDEQ